MIIHYDCLPQYGLIIMMRMTEARVTVLSSVGSIYNQQQYYQLMHKPIRPLALYCRRAIFPSANINLIHNFFFWSSNECK